MNPKQMLSYLATSNLKASTKKHFVTVYTGFIRANGLQWEKPSYKAEQPIPFIPLENEINQLIAGTSPLISTLLQLLKETGCRIIEATRTQWTDINTEQRAIQIHAAKGSNNRILPITPTLIEMLNRLPKNNSKVFQTNEKYLRANFEQQRRRIARKVNNPRLTQIHFHTLRHWKGTTEYHKTKDIIHVKTVLGHKSIESTMIYINIENALFLEDSDEWTCRTAKTADEIAKLIEAGFQKQDEIDGIHLYRKRK